MNTSNKPGDNEIAKKVKERVQKENEMRGKENGVTSSDNGDTLAKRMESVTINNLLAAIERERVGDAEMYNFLHRGIVTYVEVWDRYLVWNGQHWDEDQQRRSFQLIENLCLLYEKLVKNNMEAAEKADNKDKKQAFEQIAEKARRRIACLRDINGRSKLMEMTRQIANPLSILPDVIDKQHYLKACPNGVIDLRTGELRQGKPEQYLLNAIATEYEPGLLKIEDPCPLTNQFLLSSMDGNQELVDFIWRLLGYSLITERPDHIFVVFWGEHGRNGKDTLIKLVTYVLGKTLSSDVNVEMLLQSQAAKNGSAPMPDIMALRGTCLAWINEAEENQKFALAKLKKLTGGGLITARGLQDKQMTTWQQTHLPIMTTNELPKAKAEDAAFWQRALLLKWPLSFVDNPEQSYERKADKNLDEKLRAEAKGVLARMVRGCLQYLDKGLQIPEIVRGWTKEQRASWDDLGQFLEDWCDIEPHQDDMELYKWEEKSSDLLDAYRLWYARNKDSRFTISPKKFADIMNKKNIPAKKRGVMYRRGIRLNATGMGELEESRRNLP